MKVTDTALPGLKIIEPRVFGDDRGFFLETYRTDRFHEFGMTEAFVQDNHSRSHRHVLRGLHFTVRRPQVQTVYVSHGTIYDVAVDLRHDSPTFAKWFGIELDGRTPRMLYLPAGFAHGFCVLSESADVHYKVTHPFDETDEFGIRWNDPDLDIRWPVEAPRVKDRDSGFPLLAELGRDQLPQVNDRK